MIYCPGCGTANREGSRYCNQCGALLSDEAAATCPRCGAVNPPETVHCRECGLDMARAAREETADLVAGFEELGASEAGGEGTAPDEGEATELRPGGLPPWLDSVERRGEEVAGRRPAPGLAEPVEEELEDRLPPDQWSADAIPIEPAVGVPYRARERPEPEVTAEQLKAAELFAVAAAEEVRASPQEVSADGRPRPLGRIVRRLSAAVLLAAVLVPLLVPLAPLTAASAVPAPVVAAVKAIGDLPPDAAALVAFEYDAALAGELQPIAEAYLHQLLGQGVHVLAVSTQPEGGALAEIALERVLPAHASARYGETVLNLGYAPGGEAAVRALAVDLRAVVPVDHRLGRPLGGYPAMEGVGGARNLPLVVVLGRDLLAVQRWIEQVGAPYGTRLVAGVPSLAEPALGPYLQAGQLRGVVAGLNGAAAYERLAARDGSGRRMLGAVRSGAWATAGLVLLVNLAAYIGRPRRSRI